MSSTPYDSNVEEGDEDAEQLVTTEEGFSETIKDLPLDNDDEDLYDDLDDDGEADKLQEDYLSQPQQDYNDNEEGVDGFYYDPYEEDESQIMEFLMEPAPITGPTIDDFIEDDDASTVPKVSIAEPIDVTKIENLTKEEARKIAEEVVDLLEEDLADYLAKTGIIFPDPLSKTDGKQDGSADGKKKKKGPIIKSSNFTQTLEMTFIPQQFTLLIYKQLYPQLEDFKVKEPPSRQESENFAMQLAKEADPDIDNKRKGPEIISLSNKKQLLQPLMDNYYKDETLCTGSRFTGQFVGRQFFKGKYEHPTGATVESEFINGHFQSVKHFGLVSYPRGDTFEGEWHEGRYQTGQITFCDGLKFANSNWRYCEPPDRRFKVERYYGIQPAGKTLFSDQYPPPQIPTGMYDIGDGYYNPKNGDVRGYDGFLKRKATGTERVWFEKNCRKVHDSMEHVAPKFLPERIPGTYCDAQKRIPLTKKYYH